MAYELDGERVDFLPSQIEDLARCRPVYEGMPGWRHPRAMPTSWRICPGRPRRTFD